MPKQEDLPKQTVDGADQVEQMQGQDQSSGQVKPRKKRQASLQRNRNQRSSDQVKKPKKKQASLRRNRQQQSSRRAASKFWDWLF
jgi:hypothetical protein